MPLRAGIEGFGAAWIGAIGAAYFTGFVLGCYLVPPLVARVGHIRVYAAVAALGAIVPLLHALALSPLAWIVFRVVLGLCISGLYMVIESWLNAASSRRSRGTVFSAYIAIHLASVTAGQYLILIDSPGGPVLFLRRGDPVRARRRPGLPDPRALAAGAGQGAAGPTQVVAQLAGSPCLAA